MKRPELLCNSSGLGHHNKAAFPVPVGGDLEGVKAQQVSTYGDCSLAVSTEGHVFGWGNSEYLQLASVTETTQVRFKQKSTKQVSSSSLMSLSYIREGGTMA